MTEIPVRLFEDQAAWDAWLRKQGNSATGVWLRIAKKAAALQSVGYQEALEAALCHGWIDGQKKTYDAESWLQKFTPRGPRSVWSKINRDKALALIEAGRMRPDGYAAIERARKNRQWESAYDSHRTAEPAPDFLKALNRNAKARAFFATLTGSNRYAVLYRIQTAKRPETRQRRIDKFVQMLAKGEKLHP